MSNKNQHSLIIFLGGLAGGLCLSLVIGVVLFYSRSVQTVRSDAMPTPQSEVSLQTPLQKPTSLQAKVLDEAQTALEVGQPEKVRDLLYPTIETWTSNDDLVRGYKLLGEAELAQGHAQLAVPHYEKLYFYQPTAENLFMLATVYDAGGDLRNALKNYEELAKWDDLPPEIDIEMLNLRIEHISRALGTPVPSQTAPSE